MPGMKLHLRVMNMKLFLIVTIITIIIMMRLYTYSNTRHVSYPSQQEITGTAQTVHTFPLSYGVNFSEDVRLWYLGYSKAEIDSFKSKTKTLLQGRHNSMSILHQPKYILQIN